MVAKMATPSARQPRLAIPLTRKLSRSVSLSAAEVVVLRDVQSPRRFVGHNREIIAKGGEYDRLLVLLEGVSVRYRILHDGRRQVLNITLPRGLHWLSRLFLRERPVFDQRAHRSRPPRDPICATPWVLRDIPEARIHRKMEPDSPIDALILAG
jgi:CRP-like cAMP-binding protein